MEAKDLRIGNYFEVYEKRIEQVSELRLTSIQNYINEYFEVDCKPIPLTEEWLIKFGFIEYKQTLNFKIKANKYWTNNELKQGYLKLKFTKANNIRVENFGNKSLYFDYVHQVQNFFFALTNKELTIKE